MAAKSARHIEKMWQGLDALGICKAYEWLSHVKSNVRKLTDREVFLATFIFKDAIDYSKVRIDERAYLGPKQYNFCYVSFNTINSWGKMSDDIFIHELTHIWQYQHVGAVYIPRALHAQRSSEGYNYGGLPGLRLAVQQNKRFIDFNYEQQGDLVADYFRILHGGKPYWGNACLEDISWYEHFIHQVQTSRQAD